MTRIRSRSHRRATACFAICGGVAALFVVVWAISVANPEIRTDQEAARAQSQFDRAARFRARVVQYRRKPSFDLTNAVIPRDKIRSGGPPKDGIPALSNPRVLRADAVRYLKGADRVIGVSLGEESRAYPLKILNHHEIVNDKLGGIPIAVTYCPLCDSAAVFDRRVGNRVPEFGVSGLLYNSNVLMYDRGGRPESLWSQIGAQGVSGPGARVPLKALPVELTMWQDWFQRYPKTSVLSGQTGHARNYGVNPYQNYFQSARLMFPVSPTDKRLPAKLRVLGVWSGGKARAYPLSAFNARRNLLKQELDGIQFTLVYDHRYQTLRVAEVDKGLQWMYSFWFAWHAFRPHTEIFTGR